MLYIASREDAPVREGRDMEITAVEDERELSERASLVPQKKKILGSRPPGCVNKCMNCSPCRATLVIPPHHKMIGYRDQSSHGEDDCYYLLSWKCKCGDKLFQP
ncbi:hypothetical protein E3N88_05444 [Mikania micrantha]|uniref:Epidermal patterning factor-like protein n=1 Tax=Mikania micrantha TaxID=192012 RepID=A0A5N6PKZ9_9ASTR|nr:hypothetical protein E3N88_05444 [Mikania micrantha]